MLLLPDKGRQIILSYERQINDSLIEYRILSGQWYSRLTALVDTLTEIADMRFGEPPTPRCHGFYSGPLYWDVFGPDPIGNVRYRTSRLREPFKYWCNNHDPLILANGIRQFHNAFAFGCEEGRMERVKVIELLNQYCQRARNE